MPVDATVERANVRTNETTDASAPNDRAATYTKRKAAAAVEESADAKKSNAASTEQAPKPTETPMTGNDAAGGVDDDDGDEETKCDTPAAETVDRATERTIETTDSSAPKGRPVARNKRKTTGEVEVLTPAKKSKAASVKSTETPKTKSNAAPTKQPRKPTDKSKTTAVAVGLVGGQADGDSEPHLTGNRRSGCTIPELPTAPDGSWCLKARVVARSQTSTWVGCWGEGRKFDLFLADTSGEVVKAAVFGKGVDAFSGILTTGTTLLFSKGRVKKANPVHSAYRVELTFDERAELQETEPIPQPSIPCTSIQDVRGAPAGSKVSIIGVVAMVGSVKSLVTKKQGVCYKREFLVIDSSMRKVVCTRWNKQAEEDINDCVGKVVVITRADLNEYQDTLSLSLGPSSSVLFEPDVTEASSITEWYGNGQKLSDFVFT